jgi:hypothetical protein
MLLNGIMEEDLIGELASLRADREHGVHPGYAQASYGAYALRRTWMPSWSCTSIITPEA